MSKTANTIDTAERVIKAAHSKRNKFYKDCGINYQRIDTYLDKGIGKFSEAELKAIEDKIVSILNVYTT
jgi:tRNA(His) 5'-end guanylyltransferase